MDRDGLWAPPPSRPLDRPLRPVQLHDRMQSAGKLTICPRKGRKGTAPLLRFATHRHFVIKQFNFQRNKQRKYITSTKKIPEAESRKKASKIFIKLIFN